VTGTPVLDLDAAITRYEVRWQDKAYELRNHKELSIIELQHLSGYQQDLASLGDLDTPEAAQKYSETFQSIAAMLVVDSPEEGFPDQACAAILSFWEEQLPDPPAPQPRQPTDRQKKKSTGARSSRASKPSTAATRGAGSNSRSTR